MRIAPIVLAFAFTAPILFAQAAAAKPGSIEGVVTNSVTGEPVKKAVVRLDGRAISANTVEPTNTTTISDVAGHFHFDNVAPGSYSVSADRDGFMVARTPTGDRGFIQLGEEQHVQDI